MYYLYLKIHNITGLKYIGKTKSKDPHRYQGSGKYWKRHINKHGYDVETIILLETEDYNELKLAGLYYSELWDIVNSSDFANLKNETGDGGWDHLTEEQIQKRYDRVRIEGGTFKGKLHTEESKQKIRDARSRQIMLPWTEERKQKMSDIMRGHEISEETRKKISESKLGNPSGRAGIPLSAEHKKALSEGQKKRFETSDAPMKGKRHTDETKEKIRDARAKQENVRKPGEWTPSEETRKRMSESAKGKVLSDETRKKISDSSKGKPKPKVICPHCGKEGGISSMKQWHFNNCKFKDIDNASID